MTLALLESTVTTGSEAAALDAIVHPDTALAVWQRDLPTGLGTALAGLDLDAIDDLSLDLDAGTAIDAILTEANYPDPAAIPLAADIELLVRRHAALTGEDCLSVRLEVIETDACRRFHADYVTLRLLCAYAGPGTEWHRIEAPDAIERIPTGAVAVFKGRQLLDPPTVLHRSPPIADTGIRRLVLVIDPFRPAID